jgi:type II secretory pathway pseudopilin PulG
MNPTPSNHSCPGGSTLIEAIIAVGVLAVAIPMVFGALAESGKSGLVSQAETRSTWIIPACMDEIRASREGRPQYFTSTVTGQAFPPAGEVWVLAFSADGKPIGPLDKMLYQSGVRELNGKTVRYIAAMSAFEEGSRAGVTPMLRVDISLEFPAIGKAERRDKLDFHTRIP